MKKFLTVLIFVFSLTSTFSFGYERLYERKDLFENSSDAAIVLKVAGRVNCETISMLQITKSDNKCFGSNLSADMETFNRKVVYEEFLVVKSLNGQKKYGDMIKVKYDSLADGEDLLRIGSVYVVFFRKISNKFEYEPSDVIEYENAKDLLNKNLSYKKFVSEVLEKNLHFIPMSFSFLPDQ